MVGPTNFSYALRDIKKGEEILENYRTYKDPKWREALDKKYGAET